MEAAETHGIKIPRLCDHPELKPFGRAPLTLTPVPKHGHDSGEPGQCNRDFSHRRDDRLMFQPAALLRLTIELAAPQIREFG